ncbi:MAG: ornithine cyclodeaminase [Roseiflexaceae bacterium]|nr:ornithine cyclodeaminase [Roseiflexaceae bacterium]
MLILSQTELRQLVPIGLAIDAVAAAFAQLSSGQATVPLRQHLVIPPADGLALIMPAYLGGSAALGVKLLTLFPQNAVGPLPVIQAMVALFDPADGQPLALLDGTYLTALRTGAASGVATRHLARADARVLVIFGAGATALHQILAVCAVRPIERVLIVNRSAGRAAALADQLRAVGAPVPADVQLVPEARVALAEADVVCLATASPTPLFDDADLRPGTHINGIGSYAPHMQELPGATVARALVVVDQRAAAWAEAGDLVIPRQQGLIEEQHIAAELGELVAGQAAGRSSATQVTFFKSVGNAAQDVAVAQLAYALALKTGAGVHVSLD